MTHDYSQYEGDDKVEFNYRATCMDCEWENRRRTVECIQNSKDGHLRCNPDHRVNIEELDDE